MKSDYLYKLFFENTLDGLAYCQMLFGANKEPIDFIYIKVNKNFEKLTGLKKVEGKKVTELMPGIREANPELFEVYGRVALTGKAEKFKTYIKPIAQWFLVSVYSHKKYFFVATFQNITAQKETDKKLENANVAARNVLEDLQAEKEALAHANARDEAMLASIGDGVIIVDLNGKITFINQSAESLLGWKNDEILDKFLFEAVPILNEKGELVSEKARPMSLTLSSETSISEELKKRLLSDQPVASNVYYYVRKDKTKFPVSMTFSRVILGNKVIGAIEVFRDVTREKEIDRAKTEFVSLASHQLRTPLTAIRWYTEMILNGDAGAVLPAQKKYLEEISTGNKRMVEMVNTLLDVSRLELGTFKAEPEETDIVQLAEEVVEEQKPKIEKKKLLITKNFGPGLAKFLTDPKLLRMVFQNLLANAVEYTGGGGRINFSISLDNKKLDIKISDTGYGIPKRQQNQIFTKLFRADNVVKKDTGGTGLGLYIVKSIVENLGGKIWFDSVENKGTNFYVTFPLAKEVI